MTGSMCQVTYTPEQRARIAKAVTQGRANKAWSKEEAARVAEVNSITWKRVEDAQSVRDASLARIALAVGFDAADVDRIAAGVPDPVDDAAIREAARRLAAQDGNEKVEQYAFDSAMSNVRVAQVLQMATSGALDERGIAEATEVLEDLLIEMQPDLFDSLRRPSKLQVAQLTQQLFLADQPTEGEQDAVETTQEPSASTEDKGEKSELERRRKGRDATSEDQGVGVDPRPDFESGNIAASRGEVGHPDIIAPGEESQVNDDEELPDSDGFDDSV